jgi:PBP1b-binding outer membrane lipoprotein LpoB
MMTAMPGRVRASILASVALALLLSGCGPSAEQSKLDRTYDLVKGRLEAISHAPMSVMTYQSTLEQGGTPLDYVVASMPEHGDFANIEWQGPAAPWTVVIKNGAGDNEFVLEAYGESVASPSRSETIVVHPLSAR